MKKILYVDMDNVLVDFKSGISQISVDTARAYDGRLDEVPRIFSFMTPMKGAVEAYTELSSLYDTYILSTAPWNNPSAWSDKLMWVKKYLGKPAYKRLILTHNKDLNNGDYLIDDRTKNGADNFKGRLIQFGTLEFCDWEDVLAFLRKEA